MKKVKGTGRFPALMGEKSKRDAKAAAEPIDFIAFTR